MAYRVSFKKEKKSRNEKLKSLNLRAKASDKGMDSATSMAYLR